MIALQQLRFAYKYPFSSAASSVLKQLGTSLESISPEALQRASSIVASISQGKPYKADIREHSELLELEITAFPAAKILLSLLKRQLLYVRFSRAVADSVLSSLEAEKTEALLDLASELGIRFELAEEQFLARVNLLDYLNAEFSQDFMKLVNQRLEAGQVFLQRNEFARMISETAFKKILRSLPVNTKNVPEKFRKHAKELASRVSEKKIFSELKLPASIESFPPCMSELYARLSAGEKIGHAGNYSLAVFLAASGFPQEQMLELFKKAPNYKEHIAKYQISRISASKYTPASCDTMRSNGLCIENGALCPGIKNPIQYYKRKLFAKRRAMTEAPAKKVRK